MVAAGGLLPDRGAEALRQPCVDVPYFEGCLNHKPARALVERIAAELQVQPAIRLVEVRDADAAIELSFLGSPRFVSTGAMSSREPISAANSSSPVASIAAGVAPLGSRTRAGSARRWRSPRSELVPRRQRVPLASNFDSVSEEA